MKFAHNYLNVYDTTIAEFAISPDSRVLQHRAVLSLAQAGALDFAWTEYGRYGLGEITEHPDAQMLEDIMSLKGRLLKDMALRTSGGTRTDFAQRSVRAYERAFKATGGYYSGINVAAMSLLGKRSERTVSAKAKAVLDLLPNEKAQSKQDTYFIEASRAEALLLMGHKNKAGDMLQDAFRHDPLNYTAHATTLKQFRMIMEARRESTSWLEPFTPPAAAHFSGHIFSTNPDAHNYLKPGAQEGLRAQISEQIQRHDIGFGYGALAAGADILIAETLLEEGSELHIILPAPIDQFIATSVTPFGADWNARFDQCLAMASSLRICAYADSNWPDKTSHAYASYTAMGRAVLRAQTLFSQSVQMLIWEGGKTHSATTTDAHTWKETDRKQIVIPYPGKRIPGSNLKANTSQDLLAVIYIGWSSPDELDDAARQNINTHLEKLANTHNATFFTNSTNTHSKVEIFVGFQRAGNAAQFALAARHFMSVGGVLSNHFANAHVHIAGHYSPISVPQSKAERLLVTVKAIAQKSIPGALYVSEPFAAVLAAFNGMNYKVEYVGKRKLNQNDDPPNYETRLFHLEQSP